MSFDIRRYKPGDLTGLIALFRDTVREVNARDYSDQQVLAWAPDNIDAQQWTRRFENKAVRVAELEGAPVGFVEMARDGRSAETWARTRGLARLFTEATITARPFFERRGFHVIAPQRVIRRALEFINYRMDKLLG